MANDWSRGERRQDGWTLGDTSVIRSSTEATGPLPMWIKVGLTGVFVALVTPLVALGGLWATALLGRLAAKALALSHATLPTFPLDDQWDLRLIYLAALLVLALRTAVSRLPRPTWTIVGLGPWGCWLFIGAGLWLMACASLVFEQHVFNVPDGTHLAMLGATSTWTFATVIWLLASAGHAALVWLMLVVQRSNVAGRVTAIGGFVSMVIATPVLANPELLGNDDVYRDAPLIGSAFDQLDEAQRELEGTSPGRARPLALAPAKTKNPTEPRYTTVECMDELVTTRFPVANSPFDRALRSITSDGSSFPAAKHIVYATMIDICVDEPVRDRSSLARRLEDTVSATVKRIVNVSALSLTSRSSTDCVVDPDASPHRSSSKLLDRLSTIHSVLTTLKRPDRRLLEGRYRDGRSYATLARQMNKQKTKLRDETARAVEHLNSALRTLCR